MANWQQTVPALSELIAFEAAYRHRNFTHAAAELHYSQATVSRRINALEADLGTALFDRGRHNVHPTAEADRLAAAVVPALTELAAASTDIRRRAGQRPTLTIHADVSMTAAVVNPVIGTLQREHPDIKMRILSSFEPIEAAVEHFDVGIQYGRNRESSLIAEPIADEEVFPVCAPELAADLATGLSVSELARLPLLHVDYGEPAWVDWPNFLEAMQLPAPVALDGPTFSTYLVCLDLAERAEGIALGWGHTVGPRIEAGRLVRIPGFTLALPDAILAYRPANAEPFQPATDLLELLRSRLAVSSPATE